MKVCELIDQDTRQWDRGKVAATFTAQTRDEILSLPLNNTNGHDFVIWMENRAKKFMVKSAYKVAYRLRHQHKVEHSVAKMHGSTWNMIWSLNVPPKVHTFIWRACSTCLPTQDNLLRYRVRVDPTCEMCKQEPETTSHVLWTCPFARNVWALVRGRIQKSSNGVDYFFLLFRQMQTKVSKQGNMECSKQGDLQTILDPPEGNPGRGDGLARGIPKSDGNTKDSMSF